MATYLDPDPTKPKPPTGVGMAVPPGTTTGMPNPTGTSMPAPMNYSTSAPVPPGTTTGMPNPTGVGMPNPFQGPGMPNPTGTSMPNPFQGPGMPNPTGTSAPNPFQGPGMPNPNPGEVPIQAPPLQPANPNDPFAAMGGGVQLPGGGWVPKNHPLAQQAGPTAGGPTTPGTPGTNPTTGQPTNQAGVLGGTATAGAQTPQGQPTTVASAFQQALINRLAPQDISSQNPAIKGSIAANRNAEARGLKQTQSAMAERAAATGQAGGFESGLRQAIGESAGRQGQYEGNALYNLHQQQQQQLSDALGLGGTMLSDQQRQDLQRYGLDLDATLRREGLNAQTSLGNRELDVRNTLGMGQLDLGRRGLDQNESQFGRSLGANLGIEQAKLNQSALASLLNSLGGL